MKNRVLMAFLALSLLASACAGSEEGGGESTTAPLESSTAAPTTTVAPPTTAPGDGDGNGEPGGWFMTFANLTNAGALQVAIRDSVLTAAEVVGVEVKLYDNAADEETALRNASLMINDNPDVIAEFNVGAAVNETIGTQFNEAGVPCIGVNIPVPGCPWFRLDNAGLGEDTGKIMGQYAADRGWTGENTTVIVLSAWLAGEDVNAGMERFYNEVANLVPGMEPIDPSEIGPQTTRIGDNFVQIDTDLLVETGFQKVGEVLPSIPEDWNIVLYGINDDVTTGAVRAIEEAGRADNSIVAGLGGGAAIDSLRDNPIWLAEADIFLNYWGQYIVAMGEALVQGLEVPEITEIPTAVLTKDNVGDFYPEGETTPIMLPPVPEANEYLIPLGILQAYGNIQGLS